jgi:ABC-2 type transport system permease protein
MSFLDVFKAEFKEIFSDVALVLTIIGGVILYSFFYPQPYSNEVVSALHVSVVDKDRSDLSRRIVFELDASPKIDVIRQDLSEADAQKALLKGEIKGIIIIPRNFKRDTLLQTQPTVAVGADSSYFLIFGTIVEGVMHTVLTESAKIKIASHLKESEPIAGATKTYTSFTIRSNSLFNPKDSYVQYVVPAVYILILQQTLLIGLGILGGGINERKKRGIKGYYDRAKPIYMYLSRFIIFFSVFFIHVMFYFGFSFELFHITHLASRADLITFSVAFLSATITLGIFFGELLDSRELATPIVLFTSLPLVFSAGFVWPVEAIPEFIKILSFAFPSTPAIMGFLELNQLGASLFESIQSYRVLWIQVLVYMVLIWFIRLRKAVK